MKCKVCKDHSVSITGICKNCGAFSTSPVQIMRGTVNNNLINLLLGSFGIFIVGVIIIGALGLAN